MSRAHSKSIHQWRQRWAGGLGWYAGGLGWHAGGLNGMLGGLDGMLGGLDGMLGGLMPCVVVFTLSQSDGRGRDLRELIAERRGPRRPSASAVEEEEEGERAGMSSVVKLVER